MWFSIVFDTIQCFESRYFEWISNILPSIISELDVLEKNKLHRSKRAKLHKNQSMKPLWQNSCSVVLYV
jgi:hypothetical protein